jgi:ubiquinone/menaquinone biosynthesis C-methylase UbiE
MSTPRVYDASTANVDIEAELRRLHTQANLNVEKESRALKWFGLRDGMSLLEAGSGPGFVTEWLSRLVPNGSLTCLEIDPLLVEHARQYFKGRVNPEPRIVQGSLMETEFPDNTFDFVFVRLVFEHLPDQVGAAKEIFRILKPGGKAVIAESDFALNVITDPVVPEAHSIREKLMQYQSSLGGDSMAGRRLWRILKSAGFEHFDLEAVVAHSGDKGLDWFYPQFNPERMTPFVKRGYLTQEEKDKLTTAVNRFMTTDDGFYLRILLIGCGQKPV